MAQRALPAELPTFLRPTLRLFLSADIVGSTAFKQSAKLALGPGRPAKGGKPDTPWLTATIQFYKEIERMFATHWTTESQRHYNKFKFPPGPAPELWKAAGDELLYTKHLTDHRQAHACVKSWLTTVKSFRPELKKWSKNLDLKCTAWLAGFPVTNSEVILRTSVANKQVEVAEDDDSLIANFKLLDQFPRHPGKLIKEYIGPSIDTGFRLAGFSTPRKFIISLDLALMVADTITAAPLKFDKDVKFFYDGQIAMKGVQDGVPYPILWIDVDNGEQFYELEDRLLNRKVVDPQEVRQFALEYLEHIGDERAFVPYILGEKAELFADMPQSHLDQLKSFTEYWENEKNKRMVESDLTGPKGRGKLPKRTKAEIKMASKKLKQLFHRSEKTKN